jgi:hypothetical protein
MYKMDLHFAQVFLNGILLILGHTKRLSNMSTTRLPIQPTSPGSLFRLPAELRADIWELVIFSLAPRVCSLAQCKHGMRTHPNLNISGPGSDGLFVYDYPVSRYICRESRQEAIYHTAALGWQVPGREHPKRPYQPDLDVLYLGSYGANEFFEFLCEPRMLLNQTNPDRPIPVAAVQARKARHVAIEYAGNRGGKIKIEKLFQGCPRIDKVSMIIGNVGMEDTMDVMTHGFFPCNELPERPCKLSRVPSLEPITVDVSEASILAYTRRYLMKRVYSKVERASVEFATKADAAARLLRCQSLPQPQPAMLLQHISWGTTEESEKWEEVLGLHSGI